MGNAIRPRDTPLIRGTMLRAPLRANKRLPRTSSLAPCTDKVDHRAHVVHRFENQTKTKFTKKNDAEGTTWRIKCKVYNEASLESPSHDEVDTKSRNHAAACKAILCTGTSLDK